MKEERSSVSEGGNTGEARTCTTGPGPALQHPEREVGLISSASLCQNTLPASVVEGLIVVVECRSIKTLLDVCERVCASWSINI